MKNTPAINLAARNFLKSCRNCYCWRPRTYTFTNLRDTDRGILGTLRTVQANPGIRHSALHHYNLTHAVSATTLQALRWAKLISSDKGRYTITKLGLRLLADYTA